MQNDMKLPPELRRKWVSYLTKWFPLTFWTCYCNSSLNLLSFSYKHAIDGFYRVVREGKVVCVWYQVKHIVTSCLTRVSWPTEGVRRLFSGATMASSRGAMVTVGQASRRGSKGNWPHLFEWLQVLKRGQRRAMSGSLPLYSILPGLLQTQCRFYSIHEDDINHEKWCFTFRIHL